MWLPCSLCAWHFLRWNRLAPGAIVSTTLAWLLIQIFDLDPATGTDMLAGVLTTTPAMAAVGDSPPALIDANSGEAHYILELPVVAYSLTYPLGILVMILAIAIFGAIMKVDLRQEATMQV